MKLLKVLPILLCLQITPFANIEPRVKMINLIVKENLVTSQTEEITVPVYSSLSAVFSYTEDDVIKYYCYHYTDGIYYGYHDKVHKTD